MEKLTYKPTCYEQVIIDLKVIPTAELKMSDYPEFKLRKHTQNEFEAWVTHSRFSLFLTTLGGNDNAKKAYQQAMFAFVKNSSFKNEKIITEAANKINYKSNKALSMVEINAASVKIPKYRLLPEEIEVLKWAEKLGRGKDTILRYKDKFGSKEAVCYPYLEYPVNEGGRADVVVVFSGHQQTGTKFVEFFYHYMLHLFQKMTALLEKIQNTPKKDITTLYELMSELSQMKLYMASLGLTDNQGLTDWDEDFFFRKMHEYYMYFAHANYGGIPHSITDKLLMYNVTDTDTEKNAIFLQDTLKHYHLDNVNLIFIGYPVYQMRVMTEMAKFFSKSDINVHIRIADLPTKPFRNEEEAVMALKEGEITQQEFNALDFDSYRILSYDNLEMQGFDLISNCVANIYRETKGSNAKRFPLPGYKKFPNELKPLIQLALGYSYKNIPHELCGTDETVALALKLNRTAMLAAHDKGFSGKVQEKQQQFYADATNQKLIEQGYISKDLLVQSIKINEEQFMTELFKFYRNNGKI